MPPSNGKGVLRGHRLPGLVQGIAALGLSSAWLDGEIVVRDPDGRPDFNRLQNAFDARGKGEAGESVATKLLGEACEARREGLIAKREDAVYRSTRSPSWLKLKCQLRQEFVLAGYSLRSDDPTAIGSLLLGLHDEQGRLRSAGSGGTGWTRGEAQKLLHKLQRLQAAESPFDASRQSSRRGPSPAGEGRHWLRPVQLAEVGFSAWTPSAPSSASPPSAPPPSAPPPSAPPPSAPPSRRRAVRLTHPERVVDPQSGTTKEQVAQYLDAVSDRLLSELRGRAAAVLRAPAGVGGQVFFQKHGGDAPIPGARELPADLWPNHAPLMELSSRAALQGAAQMNVLEFHPWNARNLHIDKPDRMVFDLDPGEGVPWQALQEGAVLVHALLDELGLQSWLKTSGGKGLHVVVPLAARWRFDVVKGFARAVVQHLASTAPERFVAKSGPANRRGRIFVDYLRNGEGATTVAAWSPRARPGLGVSMPLVWGELDQVKGAAQWTVSDAVSRLEGPHVDAWQAMAVTRQSLREPMKALGFRPDADGD
jgi:bifunctional non-homologous end joining protein LigD